MLERSRACWSRCWLPSHSQRSDCERQRSHDHSTRQGRTDFRQLVERRERPPSLIARTMSLCECPVRCRWSSRSCGQLDNQAARTERPTSRALRQRSRRGATLDVYLGSVSCTTSTVADLTTKGLQQQGRKSGSCTRASSAVAHSGARDRDLVEFAKEHDERRPGRPVAKYRSNPAGVPNPRQCTSPRFTERWCSSAARPSAGGGGATPRRRRRR